jgi:hypothetical protein
MKFNYFERLAYAIVCEKYMAKFMDATKNIMVRLIFKPGLDTYNLIQT